MTPEQALAFLEKWAMNLPDAQRHQVSGAMFTLKQVVTAATKTSPSTGTHT